MNHLQEIEYRLKSVRRLKLLKKDYTYNELSEMFDLPMTVLNRYIKGHVLPSESRAKRIYKIFREHYNIKEQIRKKIKFNSDGYFDNSNLVGNNLLLSLIVSEIYGKYCSKRIDKVLTAAVDGIPIAVLTANELGIDIIIAKKTREAGVSEFIVENYSPGRTGVILSLYLPAKLISHGDHILIVEDIIRSGETQKALCRMISEAKAVVSGIFTLIGIGEEKWRNQLKRTILINYLKHTNLNTQDWNEILDAYDSDKKLEILPLIKKEEVPENLHHLIENLLKDKMIDVLIKVPEPDL
ncbi:MAG: adenine phosphoribosyltransferase [Candidatus Lokiarchaeota archaeon]|nr:adenine phosphoribosyltransferase [Candidatus Lokiarchaeota archaeon]